MSKKPLILGIESSCDETAASIVTENDNGDPIVLSSIISSQIAGEATGKQTATSWKAHGKATP